MTRLTADIRSTFTADGAEPFTVDAAIEVDSNETCVVLGPSGSGKSLLLETIAEHDPESISEAADLVGRDYKQVHRNLSELHDIGVVEFEGGGAGRAKKPTLAYDGLEIDIPFVEEDRSVDTAAP